MQSAKDFLAAEAESKLAEATAITDAAADESRALTLEERKSVENLLDTVSHLKQRVADIEENEKVADLIDQMKGVRSDNDNEPIPVGDLSVGEAFTKSAAYDVIQKGNLTGNWSSGPIEIPYGTKANVTTIASDIVQPQVLPGIRQNADVALRRLTIADLLMQGTTSSNSVKYLQETTNVNAAAAVAETETKPESDITFTEVEDPVRKVATFLPVSDEMLEDVAQIRSYLDSRLSLFVRHEEENQLLNGSGTAPNIRGLLNRTGVQTGTRSALADTTDETAGTTTIGNALYVAITNIRINAEVEPDGIVMHPTNWAQFRLAKDSALQYLGGGPMIGAYGQTVQAGETAWGLPVVVTSRIAVNTALVGAFGSMAQVFYRGGLTVEATNSHGTFFKENLTAIRAERRLALAVYRPEAFHKITALATP